MFQSESVLTGIMHRGIHLVLSSSLGVWKADATWNRDSETTSEQRKVESRLHVAFIQAPNRFLFGFSFLVPKTRHREDGDCTAIGKDLFLSCFSGLFL